MKYRKTLFTAVSLATLSMLAFYGCKGSGSTLAKVGGEKITDSDLDLVARVNPRLKPRLATPAGKQKVLENYVEQELLYQESKRRGLERTSEVKDKISLYNKIIVAQALLDDELGKKVREYYDNHKDEFERIKISHIFIRTGSDADKSKAAQKAPEKDKSKDKSSKDKKATESRHSEAEAQKLASDVKERLAKGEEFGKVAKEMSEDDRTKNNQGDLGYVTIHDKRLERMNWLPLAEKAFAMQEGDVSDVIKTEDGLHVIKVTEAKKIQPFEEAEAGIKFRLQADIRTQLLQDLKNKYRVEYSKAEKETPSAPAKPESMPAAPAAPDAAASVPVDPTNSQGK